MAGLIVNRSEGGNAVKGVVLIALGGLVLAIAAVLGPTALAGDKPKSGDERAAISRADLVGVNFIENCRFSHQAPDDPIVFPGKPGASHQHTFVGNRTTNAFSNFGSLRSSDDVHAQGRHSRVLGSRALSGSEYPAVGATIYYRRGTLAEVSAFPNNLRIIAGTAKATAPQSMGVTSWSCGVESGVDRSSTRADLPGHARIVPAPAPPLPGVLGRPQARQRRSQEPHGVRDAGRLPVDASGLCAPDHADLQVSDPRRRGLLVRLGRL